MVTFLTLVNCVTRLNYNLVNHHFEIIKIILLCTVTRKELLGLY